MAWLNATTLGNLPDQASDRDKDAVVLPDVRLTYRELTEVTDRYARGLLGLGVGPGDKVGILMSNRIEFIASLFGAAKLGAVPVPVNGRFKAYELSRLIPHSDMKVILTAPGPEGTADYPALLAEAVDLGDVPNPRHLDLQGAPVLDAMVSFGSEAPGFLNASDFDEIAEGAPLDDVNALKAQVRIRDTALLMYTSGTTSMPKGCMLTHEAVVRNGGNVARTRFAMTSGDVFWDPLPLFHTGGLVPMFGALSLGATYCHAGHFDPVQSLQMLQDEQVTVAYPAFETIWLQVLNHPDFDDYDLSSIRLIQNIAVPERLVQMQEKMPWAVEVSSYGSTECSSNLTLPEPDDDHHVRMHTLGRPVPGMQVKVVDPVSGEDCEPGVRGEFCFKGYALFDGYYKDPERTAEVIDADGWFHSGDLATIDADGRVTYGGRLKDMLKVGGENVSALEVEDYLLRHQGVNIVAVVGAPDAKYEEVPAAFVERKPGADVSEQELIDFCLDKIATFKVPRYVRFVDEWPMSGTKIQKFVLREQMKEELEEAGITEAPPVRGT